MAQKLADNLAYPPRAMRAERAAAYLGMSTSTFLDLVDQGAMPKPVRIGGMVMWDRLDLDSAFEDCKDAKEKRRNTLEELLGKRKGRPATAQ